MAIYEGIGGVARQVANMYEGIGGVARQIVKGWEGIGGVAREFYSSGTPLSSLALGSSVFLNHNGIRTEYMIVHHGLPSSIYDSSCNGTWLLKKYIDTYNNGPCCWAYPTKTQNYSASSVHSYLNSTYYNLFDSVAQSVIKQVKIPYQNSTQSTSETIASGANGVSTKVFLLSCIELGCTKNVVSDMPSDGAKLDYFDVSTSNTDNEKRKAYSTYYSGELNKLAYFTRTPRLWSSSDIQARKVSASGAFMVGSVTGKVDIRCAVIVSSDTLCDDNFNIIV